MSDPNRHRLLLGLLAAFLFLANLGGTDLWAPDEPRYAEIAREMLASDGPAHWLVPRLQGEIYTDKPPLLFWLIALASALAGEVTSLTARLPSALSGVAAVLLTRELGARLFDARAGLVSGVVLATTFRIFDSARNAQIDMLLCALVAGAMLCAVVAEREGGRPSAAGFWILCALATLAKGPLGLLLPLGSLVLYAAATRSGRVVRAVRPLSGLAITAVLAGGWVLAAQAAGGAEGYSAGGAVRTHVLSRFLEGLHHRRPAWYFLGVIPRELMPWAFFLPGGILLAWRRWRVDGDRASPFVLGWFAFVLGLFSLSAEKRNIYLLPLYPAAALLIGTVISAGAAAAVPREAGQAGVSRRWATWPAAITAAFMSFLAAAALLATDGALRAIGGAAAGEALDRWTGVHGPLRTSLAVLLPAAIAAFVFLARRRPMPAIGSLAAGAAATWMVVAFHLGPAVNDHKSARPFVERSLEAIADDLDRGGAIGSWRVDSPWFPLYGRGVLTPRLESGEQLRRHIDEEAIPLVLAEASESARIREKTGASLERVSSGSIGHREFVLLRVVREARAGDTPAEVSGPER